MRLVARLCPGPRGRYSTPLEEGREGKERVGNRWDGRQGSEWNNVKG